MPRSNYEIRDHRPGIQIYVGGQFVRTDPFGIVALTEEQAAELVKEGFDVKPTGHERLTGAEAEAVERDRALRVQADQRQPWEPSSEAQRASRIPGKAEMVSGDGGERTVPDVPKRKRGRPPKIRESLAQVE